jgi:phosphoribosylformylglycinamidine cyclo-ligase
VFEKPGSALPIEAQHQQADLTYRQAGVDIEAGEEAVRLIKADAESTYIPGVLGSLGGFAGMFQLPSGLQDGVLVTSTDGVGTKLLLAQQTGKLDGVGIDLVGMSVNDVLTVGARPILFLDYVAVGRLLPGEMVRIVAGVAEGCRLAGCALVGGEMAEMPGLYDPGEFDLAGFCVGLGERSKLIDGSTVQEGDIVLGLASSGFHSNGYSLVRKVLDVNKVDLDGTFPGVSGTVAEALLAPTRIYVKGILGLIDEGIAVKSMAHITGGGMIGNFSRVVPAGLSAQLHFDEWKVPPLFRAIQALGGIAELEMFTAFNMGVGYVLVVPPADVTRARELLTASGEEVFALGTVVPGSDRVTLQGVS